jgi:ankyrin repeat protein
MKKLITLLALNCCLVFPLAAQAPVQLTPEEQALMEAAYTGDLEEVRRLVVDGTSIDFVDVERRGPLMFAAFNGHAVVVEFLLDAGAEIDKKDSNGRTALMYASSGPFAETVDLLLVRGGRPCGLCAYSPRCRSRPGHHGCGRRHRPELCAAERPH